jgi:hypothetical protein
MDRKLKLYVWEGVFADWYPGLAFALAYDVREARRLVIAKYGVNTEYARAEVAGKPQVIRLDVARPQAWQVSGGG